MHDYLGCVLSVDRNIGRVLDYLDKHGMRDNTLVMYSSDQGFYLGEHGWFNKQFMYEESLHMPLVVRYPPLLKPGTVTNQLFVNTNFAPTILKVAGLPVPADMQGNHFCPYPRLMKLERRYIIITMNTLLIIAYCRTSASAPTATN